MRKDVERYTKKRVDVKVEDMNQASSEVRPDTDAALLAQGVAEQLAGRVAFRRAMRRAVQTAMRAGALGVRVACAGRLGDRHGPQGVVPRGPGASAHAPGEGGLRDGGREDDVRRDRREGVGLPRRRGAAPRTGERAALARAHARAERGERGAKPAATRGKAPATAEPACGAPDVVVPDAPSVEELSPTPPESGSEPASVAPEAMDRAETAAAPEAAPAAEAPVEAPDTQGVVRADARSEADQAPQAAPRADARPRQGPHRHPIGRLRDRRDGAGLDHESPIEAARVAITRHIRRGGKVWITIFPDKPVTKKPAETRMGSGAGTRRMGRGGQAGSRDVRAGRVNEALAREAMSRAQHKLPIRTKFITRVGE